MEAAVNSDHQFVSGASVLVQNCTARYPEYHTDLVKLLVTVANTQAQGRSKENRRSEVQRDVEAFGARVLTKVKEI